MSDGMEQFDTLEQEFQELKRKIRQRKRKARQLQCDHEDESVTRYFGGDTYYHCPDCGHTRHEKH